MGSVVKESAHNVGDTEDVGYNPTLWLEDSLEEGMAAHFSLLAWRILWDESLGVTRNLDMNE